MAIVSDGIPDDVNGNVSTYDKTLHYSEELHTPLYSGTGKTPMYGGQTPMYGENQTPMNESASD
jgi:hypothetical protein